MSYLKLQGDAESISGIDPIYGNASSHGHSDGAYGMSLTIPAKIHSDGYQRTIRRRIFPHFLGEPHETTFMNHISMLNKDRIHDFSPKPVTGQDYTSSDFVQHSDVDDIIEGFGYIPQKYLSIIVIILLFLTIFL